MQFRYSYRIDPRPRHHAAFATAFGCARVVFNDALAARQAAFDAGAPYVSDAELSRRLTASKDDPGRGWLTEVSSVVLQQALADLNTAYRNLFASVTGKRTGPKVAAPRFRSRRDSRQAIRFTANSRFKVLDNGRLRLPKVGEARAGLGEPGSARRRGIPGWSTVNPVVMTVTLVTQDGVPIDAVHLPPPGPPADRDLALVVVHGFTMTWQRPVVWRLVQRFNASAGVVTLDCRGHGRSGGLSTLGDKEIDDLDVAVRYARELGYQRVAAVGFSMGGSVVLRHGALRGGTDAVISVSGPGRWFYRGTVAMRRVHLAAEKRLGRAFSRYVLNTRISPDGWPTPDPMPPAEAASRLAPVPVLIVHGDQDIYFPPDHGQQLYDAAKEPKELWLVPGFGHAERHADDALIDRIAAWADKASAAFHREEQATAGPG